jgi:hypothetical protein
LKRKTLLLAGVVFISSSISWSSHSMQSQSSVFSRNVETHQLTSRVFQNTRALRVLLPPDYHAPANARRGYPVFTSRMA